MVNNGSLHYDHDRDGTHTMVGGCEVKFRNMEHDTFIAIRYENDVLTGEEQGCQKVALNAVIDIENSRSSPSNTRTMYSQVRSRVARVSQTVVLRR